MRPVRMTLATLFAALMMTACGGSDEDTVDGKVTITAADGQTEVAVGAELQLTAAAFDGEGKALADATFTWSSESLLKAVVDANGKVTGKAAGEVRITASSEGRSGNITITVK